MGTIPAVLNFALMKRFYFDLECDGEEPTHDEDGDVLPDLDAAQVEAAGALRDFSRELLRGGKPRNSLAVIVRDDNGPVLRATLNFEIKRLN